MKNTLIYDIDKASDSTNTSNYNLADGAYIKTDHVVNLFFTDNPLVTFSN